MSEMPEENKGTPTKIRMTDLLQDNRTTQEKFKEFTKTGLPALISSIVIIGIFLAAMVLLATEAEKKKKKADDDILQMQKSAATDQPKLENEIKEEKPKELEPSALPKVEETDQVNTNEEEFNTVVNDTVNPYASTNEKFGASEGTEDNTDTFTMSSGGKGLAGAIGLGSGSGAGGGAPRGSLLGGSRMGRRHAQKANLQTTEKSVLLGLEWLKNHQNPDGSWSATGYSANCDSKKGAACTGRGSAVFDVGVTGLALLAFLGAGYTPDKQSEYSQVTKKCLKWLKDQQDDQGCFGSRGDSRFTYNHACATIAMCEAAGSTTQQTWKKSAEAAIGFASQCQNPYQAWRYGMRPGDNDSSVTGWMLMAYHAARDAKIPVNERSMKDGLTFIDSITDEDTGRTGYTKKGELPVRPENLVNKFPATESEALTAVSMCARIFCDDTGNPLMKKGAELLSKRLPTWDEAAGKIDMYYWYYGTLAMYQVGGPSWDSWNKAMKAAVVDSQKSEKDGCQKGSWDPVDAWGEEGGRVYSTAILTLCLEVYYRFPKVFGAKGSGKGGEGKPAPKDGDKK